MMFVSDNLVLTGDWCDLRDGGREAERIRVSLRQELQRELVPGHPLYGIAVEPVARRVSKDDVLFSLADGRWGIVHLTWRRAREVLPFPTTDLFDSVGGLNHALATE
jgi:hypothetical protein